VNKSPGKPMDPLTGEFLRLVLARDGQEVVLKDGYFPITSEIGKEESSKLFGKSAGAAN
jgi:phosphate transport system substrate-binding protein